MRLTLLLAILACVAGCATYRPVGGSTLELREQIASGNLLKTGDHVLLVTTDNVSHEFKVTAIRSDVICGANERVPVDTVVSVDLRHYRLGAGWWKVGSTLVLLGTVSAYGASQQTHAQAAN